MAHHGSTIIFVTAISSWNITHKRLPHLFRTKFRSFFRCFKPKVLEAILSLPHRYKWLVPGFKVLLILLLMWALYAEVLSREDFPVMVETFRQELQWSGLPLLLLALVLMPVNWALETLKWRTFTQSFSRQDFWHSYRAVLAGVAISLITPNRIGDYGGRVLLSEQRQEWRVVVSTLLGGLSQMIVLFSAGIVGFAWFSHNYLDWQLYPLLGILIGAGCIVAMMVVAFFRLQQLIPLIRGVVGIKWWKKIRRHIVVLRASKDRQRLQSLQWALLRYIIYSLQYWLMLAVLGVDLPVMDALAAITTIFLLQTSVPLPPVGALLARAEIALFIWGRLNVNEISALAATFGLFIINLALPALLGTVFIVKTKEKITRL